MTPPSHLAQPERRARRGLGPRLGTLTVLLAVWAAGGALLLVVVLQRAVPARDLLVDPVTATGSAWYAGSVTSLGVLAWTVASAACAASAYAAALDGRPGAVRAFRGAALLFAVLLADDLFLLHSDLLPRLLGADKLGVQAALALLVAAWLVPSLPEVRRTRWEILAASAGAFAASLAVDVLVPGPESGQRLLVEDGAKFLGVLALAAWSTATARDVVRSTVTAAGRPPAPAGPAPAAVLR